jgi:hypothetical protein
MHDFNPLQEDISVLSDEEISNRIKSLSKKVGTARRGRNPELLSQLNQALQAYQNAIRERRIEAWYKKNKEVRGEPDLGDLVNIE